MKQLAFYIVLFLITSQSFGQSLTLSATESRCTNSGTITVQIDSGNPIFSYEIYDGPSGPSSPSYPVTQLSSDSTIVFYNLIPGEFFVRVVDQDTTLIDSITVIGTYTEPSFTLAGFDIACPGDSSGFIYIETAQDGRLDYTYQMVGPDTGAIQSSDTFYNLTAGEYQIRLFDSCGNYQTRSFTLAEIYDPLWMDIDGNPDRYSCDSATFRVLAERGVGPYTYRVVDPENSSNYIYDTTTTENDFYFDLPLKYGTDTVYTQYHFEVTDACGTIALDSHTFYFRFVPSDGSDCDSMDLYLGGSWSNSSIYDSIYVSFYPDTLGLDTFVLYVGGDSLYYFRFPIGQYTMRYYTACGDSGISTFGYIPPPLDTIVMQELLSGCYLDKAELRVIVPSLAPNWNLPGGPFNIYVEKDGLPFDTAYNYYDPIHYYFDIDSGYYEAWVWNKCGDTANNAILIDSVLEATISTTTNPGCGLGDGSLTCTGTVNNGESITYVLYNLTTGAELANNTSGSFFNLDTGRYRIGLRLPSWCEIMHDTAEILQYVQPTLTAKSLSCQNGSYAVKAEAEFGNAPYTYYLRDPSNSFAILSGPVSTDTFTGLTGAGPYNILVEDACGNTANASASPYVPDVEIVSTEGLNCNKHVFRIGTDTVLQSSFSWTGPNGFTSNRRRIRFNPIEYSDTGEYILTSNILGGCLVLHDTFDIIAYSVTDAIASATNPTCYGISVNQVDSILTELNGNTPAIDETSLWELTTAPIGATYQIKADTADTTQLWSDLAGNYVLTYTITSPEGCTSQEVVDFGTNCSTTVPVELIDFYGIKQDYSVDLFWSTASESNNDKFIVQRSKDNVQWDEIGEVEGAGNSQSILLYSFKDINPLDGLSYYRLKQVDFDHSFEYSETVIVEFSNVTKTSIHPNPASNNISITSHSQSELQVDVLDLSGAVILSTKISSSTNLDISGLRKGVYFIKISDLHSSETVRLIKQ